MAVDSNQQILAQLQFLNQSMKSLVKALDKPEKPESQKQEVKRTSAHKPETTTMSRLKGASMKDLAADITQMRKEFGQLGDGTTLITKDFKELASIQSAYAKSVMESSELNNTAQERLTDEIKKTITTTSIFGRGLVDASSTTAQVFDKYSAITEVLEDYNDILKKQQITAISEMQDDEKRKKVLKALWQSMGKLDDQAKAEFKAKMVLANKGDKVALQQIETQMRLLGVTRDNILGTIEKTAKVGPAISTLSDSLKKFVNELPIAKIGTFAGSFALFTSGAKALFQQFQMAAQAGFGNSLLDLNKGSLTLGVSVEALTKILNSNRQQLNKMGMDDYIKSLKTAQLGLMQLGLTSEQAAAFQANALSLAQNSGVALNDTKNLSKVVNAQTDAFETLRNVTGTTAEEFANLQKNLLNDQNMRISLARLDANGKAQMVADLAMEQKRLTLAGLNNDQMTKMIQANQTVLGQKVADRMTSAAKMLSTASMLGMGDQGMEAYNIMLKGRRASGDEKARLTDITASMRGVMDQAGGGDLMTEHLMDQLGDNLDPASKELLDAGRNLNLAAAAQMGVSVEEAKKIAEAGKISPALAKAMNIGDQIGAALRNPFTMIAAGIGGMYAALLGIRSILQTGFAQLASQLGGGNTITNAASAGGNGKLGKMRKIAGKAVAGASAIDSAMDANSDMSSDISGGAIGIAGAIASGPLGAITAAISGIAGAMKGWDNAATIFNTEAATTGQKVAAGAAGFLHGVTFGLVGTEGAANFLYSMGEGIEKAWTGATDWITNTAWPNIQASIGNAFSWIMDDAIPEIEAGIMNALQFLPKIYTRAVAYVTDFLGNIAGKLGFGDTLKDAAKSMNEYARSSYTAADFGAKASTGLLTAADYGATAADNNKKAADVQAKAVETQKAATAVSSSNLLGTTSLANLSAQSVIADAEVKKAAAAPAAAAATSQANATQPAANGSTINTANKTNGEITNADLYRLLSDILATLVDGRIVSEAQLEALKNISGNTKKKLGGTDLATFVAN